MPAEGVHASSQRFPPRIPVEGFALRAVIFANGPIRFPALDRAHLRSGDWLIGADGGAHHLRALGLIPQTVIGDLDSLSPSDLLALEQAGVEILRHPPDKDQTDLELALRLALARGADQALVLGALGDRWDQTLANLLLPAAAGLEALALRLVDGPEEIVPLHAGQQVQIEGSPGDTLSLIPLGGEARGVTTRGLEYTLTGGRLPFGATLGVSNRLIGPTAVVRLQHGLVLCILRRGAALDEEKRRSR